MAWYRIAENVLDAIADAINAKTGHTAPMTPVEMVSEIQSIQTGGGSLPSSISKIDGGSFTPASDTAVINFNITHTLGVAPKGYVLWADDVFTEEMAVGFNYIIAVMFSEAHISLNSVTNYSVVYNKYITSTNGTNSTSNNLQTEAQSLAYADSERIRYYNAALNFYYKQGITYKWLAWA